MPADTSSTGTPRVPTCLHLGCSAYARFGFGRAGGTAKSEEMVWACLKHRYEGQAWWREVNGT